ncbi:MAG: hydrogenase nickel incorporation protein HypB [Candidatus Obscuribacterales bacterium]|nr:hydrogenase nickel incorporation protein HypB [Candidatus Obscuribacterales bacterium]
MHGPTELHILERLLEDNEQLASHNQEHFDELGLLAVNLMSAPGAGKTSLIKSTAKLMPIDCPIAVIEGDMVGELDVERLREDNIPAYQISTGRACHLDAQMVAQLLHTTKLPDCKILFLENVGNLVCPAEFPLGEHLRIVLLSITEGDDKPIKYPVIFHNCDAVIFTKSDLLPFCKFSLEKAKEAISNLNPAVEFFVVSTISGDGLLQWRDWIVEKASKKMSHLQIGL